MDFKPWAKIPRLSGPVIVTEKIDGTNALVFVSEDCQTVLAGSRSRWITPAADNHLFAAWVNAHQDDLRKLGPGYHYGEFWGLGIQRGYGLFERRFSLFNTSRWSDVVVRPSCCEVVPVLATLPKFDYDAIDAVLADLQRTGSRAAPGYMKPEGIVVFHERSRMLFKKTFEKDEGGKGL